MARTPIYFVFNSYQFQHPRDSASQLAAASQSETTRYQNKNKRRRSKQNRKGSNLPIAFTAPFRACKAHEIKGGVDLEHVAV